jgi:hypothetical protein
MLIEIFKTVLIALRSVFRSRAVLLAENVVLRQQIIVLQRSVAKPRIRRRDLIVLAFAARMFGEVLKAVTIVRPETVVRWHRSFWHLIWRKESRRPVGRPPADADLRGLIWRFWTENPLWGEDKIAAELGKLGYKVSSPNIDRRTCRGTVVSPGPRLSASTVVMLTRPKPEKLSSVTGYWSP